MLRELSIAHQSAGTNFIQNRVVSDVREFLSAVYGFIRGYSCSLMNLTLKRFRAVVSWTSSSAATRRCSIDGAPAFRDRRGLLEWFSTFSAGQLRVSRPRFWFGTWWSFGNPIRWWLWSCPRCPKSKWSSGFDQSCHCHETIGRDSSKGFFSEHGHLAAVSGGDICQSSARRRSRSLCWGGSVAFSDGTENFEIRSKSVDCFRNDCLENLHKDWLRTPQPPEQVVNRKVCCENINLRHEIMKLMAS